MSYRLGDFELDLDRVELRRGGRVLPLQGRVFDLLVHLVRHPDRVISHTELIQHIWEGAVVSDDAVYRAVKAARKALGDDGRRQEFIHTIRGRGFRYVGPIAPLDREPADASAPVSPSLPGYGDRPAIAVLPFETTSEDQDEMIFARGLAGDLITHLSRWRLFPLIARGSSFAVDPGGGITAAAEHLGVRYLVGGHVDRSGGLVRVAARLVDAVTGAHVWADSYDRPVDDVFAVRDEIQVRSRNDSGPQFESAWRAQPSTEPGVYELRVRAGAYDLQIVGSDILPSRRPIQLVAGQEEERVVRVSRGSPYTFEIRFVPSIFTKASGSLRVLDHRGDIVLAEGIIEPFSDPDTRLVRLQRVLPPGSYLARAQDYGTGETRAVRSAAGDLRVHGLHREGLREVPCSGSTGPRIFTSGSPFSRA